MILPPSRPEGTRAGGTGGGVAGRRGPPQERDPCTGLCQAAETQRGLSGEINPPISLFSHPPRSLGFPSGEHGPRSEIGGQGHSTQRSVSRAWRGWKRVKNEPGRRKRLSGIASVLDVARVWEKEFFRLIRKEENYYETMICMSQLITL